MRRPILCVLVLVASAFVSLGLASPASAGCTTIADDLGEVSQVCEYTDQELQAMREQNSAGTWEVYQICQKGTSGGAEACSNPKACELNGVVGTWYIVRLNGETIGRACLTSTESEKYDRPPIRVLVIEMFKDLDWPASDLVVEPPDGRTLVNLETNFYTTNTDSTVIPVTLVESEVRINAEPVSYTWHYGDGTSMTTTIPGNPYPDLDVAHVYEQVDEVMVSVDTTYGNASFSVGGGEWEAIPSTLVVPGAEQDLAILEAKPQLVIR